LFNFTAQGKLVSPLLSLFAQQFLSVADAKNRAELSGASPELRHRLIPEHARN
jgi:hypothetical protein